MVSFRGTAVRLIAAFSLLALLGGCQSTKEAGKGPLTLSPEVTQLYEDYKNKARATGFVVSYDERYGTFSYCPGGADACKHEFVSVYACERDAGSRCGVLAMRGMIVWEGAVTAADGTVISTYNP